MYNMRQIKKLTWLRANDLGDVWAKWCNSLGDSLFQILCDEFCRLCVYFYSYITSHISQAFASCTHYTSYFLLNLVHYICVILLWPSKIGNSLILMQNVFKVWDLRANLLKILFLKDLGWIQIFLKNFSSHTHAFYS